MGRSVAFFRNLNLGQGWAPTRPQLVGAFESAGATDVDNIQVNGTVAFSAVAPVRTAAEVRRSLLALTGYDDIVVVRPAGFVRRLADRLAAAALPADAPVEVALFDARVGVPSPWTSPDGRVELLWGDHRHAVTLFHPDGRGGSPANAWLQQLVGVRVTCRGATTILRVAARVT